MPIDIDDFSDIIAGLQVAFRLLGWSLETPRISGYLLKCHERYVESYPEYAHLFPLPWTRLAHLPDPVLIQLALKITRGGFIEEKIRRADYHSPARLAGQDSATQGTAVVEVVSRGADQ